MKKFLLSLAALIVSFSAFAQDKDPGTYDLTAEDFKSWSAADGTGIETGNANCTLELNVSTGMPYGDGNVYYLNYADLSKAKTLVITATAGTPRLLFNRTVDNGTVGYEYPASTEFVTTETNDGVTTYTVDIESLVKAQGFAHLHAIKGANWANTTVTSMQYIIPDAPIAPVYLPVTIKAQAVTPLTELTGYSYQPSWTNTITYPKVFQSQGEVFGNGEGSAESEHVDISEYSKLTFDVKTGSNKDLALRVWIWDDVNSKVVTLYPYPEAEFETADFTQPCGIMEPGLYSVNISEYKYLKGVKAANKWEGQTPIVVENAFVSNGESPYAIDEALTFSSNSILDFSATTDVEAYIATAVVGENVAMKKVTGAVPANTGLILVQKSEKSIISIPTCGEATEDVAGNLLVATTAETSVPTGAYVLAGSGDELGWYTIGTTPATLAAGKCYLATSSSAKSLKMTFGDATAIKNVENTTSNNAIYSVQGIKVATPVKGNMYIMNGKKVIY